MYLAVGSGQVLGSLHFIVRPRRRGRPVRAGTSEARMGVEATPSSQTDEDLAQIDPQAPAAASRDGRGGVEDEQRNGLYVSKPAQQGLHLLGGHLVGVLGGPDALHVEGRSNSRGRR